MAYSAWSVVAGEQPTAAKWNILGTNDSSFNDGTGIAAGAIGTTPLAAAAVSAAKMKYGMVRQRQGGTSGDAAWATSGTSNTDTSAKDVFIQAGAIAVNNTSGVTVTFPVAFTQIPLVFATTITAGSNSVLTRVFGISASQFVILQFNSAGTTTATESASWLAIGQ